METVEVVATFGNGEPGSASIQVEPFSRSHPRSTLGGAVTVLVTVNNTGIGRRDRRQVCAMFRCKAKSTVKGAQAARTSARIGAGSSMAAMIKGQYLTKKAKGSASCRLKGEL